MGRGGKSKPYRKPYAPTPIGIALYILKWFERKVEEILNIITETLQKQVATPSIPNHIVKNPLEKTLMLPRKVIVLSKWLSEPFPKIERFSKELQELHKTLFSSIPNLSDMVRVRAIIMRAYGRPYGPYVLPGTFLVDFYLRVLDDHISYILTHIYITNQDARTKHVIDPSTRETIVSRKDSNQLNVGELIKKYQSSEVREDLMELDRILRNSENVFRGSLMI